MPGQTASAAKPPAAPDGPFNGGPGNCPAKQDYSEEIAAWAVVPSMEGRAIARPNPRRRQHRDRAHPPSMEGRAIARPNMIDRPKIPAWRIPSMEGRAIARPNPR